MLSYQNNGGVPAIKGVMMKIEELKSLIEEHTKEDVLDHEALNKAINMQFDALIDSKLGKYKETSKGEVLGEFIKEQGFENIDQYNAFLKNTKATSTELSEKATRYEQELEQLKSLNASLKSQNDEYTYMSKLNDVDDRFKKFVYSEIRGLVNDDTDFDTAKSSYLANNANYLKDNEKIVTKLPKNQTPNTQTDGVTAILEKKHGIKLE